MQPHCEIRLNIRVVFDYGPFAPLCENMTSSIKPEEQRIALQSEDDRATARGSMYSTFGEI